MAITLNGKRRTYRQMAFKKTRPNLDLGAEDIRNDLPIDTRAQG